MSKQMQPPDALLLMGTHCPWCPKVLESLQALLADGAIASLETVNVEEHPVLAAELNIRTVPWVRIGPFELEGMRSTTELREWAEKAGSEDGLLDWLNELLMTGKLEKVEQRVRQDPATLVNLIKLFAHPDTQLNTRVGISAIIEGLEGSSVLKAQTDRLAELTRHPDSSIRGDACHFLALTGSPGAKPLIESLLDDPVAEVRSVATDCIEHLQNNILH